VESALYQLREGDEIIVAGDLRNGPLEAAHELCGRLNAEAPAGACVRFVGHDGGRPSWGHDPINHAMTNAKGEYLTFGDDDDVYTAGAFDAMRQEIAALASPAPLLFRFMTHYGIVCWQVRGLVRQATIGGHCCVFPNLPSLLGQWGPHYEGDFTFLKETLDLWAAVGVEPVFVDRLIAVARPAVRYQ
jgi:hypothetical protein